MSPLTALQIWIICCLIFAIGVVSIVQHPEYFDHVNDALTYNAYDAP
jgi:hypothetical protein